MSRWLALDISTISTGFALYETGAEGCILCKSGVVTGEGKLARDRFPGLAKKIAELIRGVHPDTVVVEGAFYRQGMSAIEYLLKLQGIVEALCSFEEITFATMTTGQWRCALGFPANFKKESRPNFKALSIEYASRLSGASISSDDEADAICIGYAYSLPKKQAGKKKIRGNH